MFPLSMWILSLFSIKSSWQKLDCKNSKNSIESVDRPINFTLSSNSLFWPPSKNSSYFGTSPLSILDKISVSSGIGNSFIFWSSSSPRYPSLLHRLPLERALRVVLINKYHLYQDLVFRSLVPSPLYYLPYQLDLL